MDDLSNLSAEDKVQDLLWQTRQRLFGDTPIDCELEELRRKVDEKKKREEIERLKSELRRKPYLAD